MRNGGLRIPSLMMSFGNGSSQKSTVFDIQKNNLFMGPKRPAMEFKILTPDQSLAIQERLNEYKSIELKQILLASVLTLIIASGLLLWVF